MSKDNFSTSCLRIEHLNSQNHYLCANKVEILYGGKDSGSTSMGEQEDRLRSLERNRTSILGRSIWILPMF